MDLIFNVTEVSIISPELITLQGFWVKYSLVDWRACVDSTEESSAGLEGFVNEYFVIQFVIDFFNPVHYLEYTTRKTGCSGLRVQSSANASLGFMGLSFLQVLTLSHRIFANTLKKSANIKTSEQIQLRFILCPNLGLMGLDRAESEA